MTADPKPRRAQVAADGQRGVGVGGPDPEADIRQPHPFDASSRPRDRIGTRPPQARSEEHTSELQSLMRISYAVFCLKKKNKQSTIRQHTNNQHEYNTNHKIKRQLQATK